MNTSDIQAVRDALKQFQDGYDRRDTLLMEGVNFTLKKAVLGTILITSKNRPLSVDALYDFMQTEGTSRTTPKSALKAIIGHLRSVLYEDPSKGGIIRVCHPSFLEFLESQERCGEYWTNPEQLHQRMIERSLVLMKTSLRFNICELETSSVANKDIPDLGQKVNNKVCESLQYSCLYWVSHFAEASRQTIECHVIEFFRSLRVLYWLEVLGLIGGMRNGLDALRCLAGLYEVCFNFPRRDLS